MPDTIKKIIKKTTKKIGTLNPIDLCYFTNPLYKKDIVQIFKFNKNKKIMVITK